jgi:hypothetical protein
MREQEGESIKHGMVTLTPEFVTFGHGRHAWYKFPLEMITNII